MIAANAIPISRDAVADVNVDVVAANAHADEPLARGTTHSAKASAQAAGQSTFHESARAQVVGAATYVDDIPEIKGTLYAAPILSTVGHGKLLGVDRQVALAMPGVVDVVLAADIPGDAMLAAFAQDEPVFAINASCTLRTAGSASIRHTTLRAARRACITEFATTRPITWPTC